MNQAEKILKDLAQYRKAGDYDAALSGCNALIAEDCGCESAYRLRSRVFHDLGRYSDAFSDLDTLLELRPGALNVYFERADWYLRLGKDQAAIEDATKLIESGEPYFIDAAYFFRSVALLNLGKLEEAMRDCNQLPDNAQAYVTTFSLGGKLLSKSELTTMIGRGKRGMGATKRTRADV